MRKCSGKDLPQRYRVRSCGAFSQLLLHFVNKDYGKKCAEPFVRVEFTTVQNSHRIVLRVLEEPAAPLELFGNWNFADHHGFSDLQNAAQCYAEKHFLEVIKSEEFLKATFEQIAAMLKSDYLDIASEKEVFDSVIQWITHDESRRRRHLPEFLKDIRLTLLPPKILGKRELTHLISDK